MTLGMGIWCVAAFVLGGFLGYIFSWAKRHNPKPDAKEVAALVGVVVGGGVISLVRELVVCPSALAWYVIGLPIGFSLYLVALRYKWDLIATLISEGRLKGVPLFPWTFKP